MTEPLTAQKLAEAYSEGARKNYDGDGHLTPILHVLDAGGLGVSLVPNPSRFNGQPREQLSALVAMVSDVIDVAFVATITEGWIKTYPEADFPRDLPNLERGQLQRESETDPEVRTSAMVSVYDVSDLDQSYSVISAVKGDPRDHEWDIMPQEGRPLGGFPEDVIKAYLVGSQRMFPIPHDHTIEQRLEWLIQIDFIVIGMAAIEDTERN